MFASLWLVALVGILPISPVAGEPVWYRDYSIARQQGVTANKPLMVIIGSGQQGWNTLSKEGAWSKGVQHLLAESYICVYVDTEEEKGKQLATAFEVVASGLVISNRDSSIQVFRHEGSIGNDDLERFLDRYADPFFIARATETPLQERTSFYYQPPAAGFGHSPAPVCRT